MTTMWQGRLRVSFLGLADLLCVYGAWVMALWGYRAVGLGHYEYGFDFYLSLWPVGFAFVALNAVFKLYHGNPFYPAAPVSPVEELRRLIASSFVTHLAVIAFLALSRQTTEHYSRAVIVLSGLFTAVAAQPVRNVLRLVLFGLGAAQIPVVLAGSGTTARRVAASLKKDAYTGFLVRQTFDRDAPDIVSEAKRLGVQILVACEDLRLFKLRIGEFRRYFTYIEYLPTAEAFPILDAATVVFDGVGGLEMVNQRRMQAIRIEKWLLDKFLAVLAFVFLLPFFIVIPLLVKLTSKGPVFYRQERLGRKGCRIRVWKFRSMYADADARLERLLASDPERRAEWEANFKLKDDPRITPLGRFLRRTSMDEFPQLFNVFAGDMALVGPRPIVAREVPLYGGAYETFASVKPGVTGLWQVSGRSDTDYDRRVALDTYYVLNWSPWMDIWILFRTIGAVCRMKGAC